MKSRRKAFMLLAVLTAIAIVLTFVQKYDEKYTAVADKVAVVYGEVPDDIPASAKVDSYGDVSFVKFLTKKQCAEFLCKTDNAINNMQIETASDTITKPFDNNLDTESVSTSNDDLPVVAVVDTGCTYKSEYVLPSLNGSNGQHGTAMCKIIENYSHGKCLIQPINIVGKDGYGNLESLYKGVYSAVDNGADYINISMASVGWLHNTVIDNLFAYCKNNGVTVVCAAGNDYLATDLVIPGRCKDVITVSAVNSKDELTHYSNYGDAVDVASYGAVDIDGVTVNGTSVSAALVTACLVDGKTIDSARDVLDAGYDIYTGNGVLCPDGFVPIDDALDTTTYQESILGVDWKNLSDEELNELVMKSSTHVLKAFVLSLSDSEMDLLRSKNTNIHDRYSIVEDNVKTDYDTLLAYLDTLPDDGVYPQNMDVYAHLWHHYRLRGNSTTTNKSCVVHVKGASSAGSKPSTHDISGGDFTWYDIGHAVVGTSSGGGLYWRGNVNCDKNVEAHNYCERDSHHNISDGGFTDIGDTKHDTHGCTKNNTRVTNIGLQLGIGTVSNNDNEHAQFNTKPNAKSGSSKGATCTKGAQETCDGCDAVVAYGSALGHYAFGNDHNTRTKKTLLNITDGGTDKYKSITYKCGRNGCTTVVGHKYGVTAEVAVQKADGTYTNASGLHWVDYVKKGKTHDDVSYTPTGVGVSGSYSIGTVNAYKKITVNVARKTHTVTASGSGGTTVISGNSKGDKYYASGALKLYGKGVSSSNNPITVTATADDNHVFSAWSIAGVTATKNGDTATFNMPDNNVTCNPVFRLKQYTIVLDPGTESVTTSNVRGWTLSNGKLIKKVNISDKVTLPAVATCFTETGYHADGKWYLDDAVVTSPVTKLTDEDGATVTLSAKFTPNTYTVRMNKYEATEGLDYVDVTCTYGTPKTLPANTFKRNNGYGYSKFLGWKKQTKASNVTYKQYEQSVDFVDRGSVLNLTTVNNGIVNLYPVFDDYPQLKMSGGFTMKLSDVQSLMKSDAEGNLVAKKLVQMFSTRLNGTSDLMFDREESGENSAFYTTQSNVPKYVGIVDLKSTGLQNIKTASTYKIRFYVVDKSNQKTYFDSLLHVSTNPSEFVDITVGN